MNTNKLNKVFIIIYSIVLTIIISFSIVYFLFLYRYQGRIVINNFDSSEQFDISKIKTVEKKENKDFIILNLADIQLQDTDSYKTRKTIINEIKYLIKEIKPDLITLTGDQTWSNENLISIKTIISTLDSYKIPWAPVFGNHDYGNDYDRAVASKNYLCELYENSKYCLFDRGPTNIGSVGNYAINVVENNKIIKTLYFMDAGYNDIITEGQAEWFKWTSDGIKKSNNDEYSESMLFIHKPLPEYYNAFNYGEKIGESYYYCSMSGVYQTGFFDIIKERGMKNIICGHQHTNSMSYKYEGVTMTFALKTGELSFYYDDGTVNLNGATYLTISDTNTTINNYYVLSNQFHIDGSENIYETYYK